MGRIVWAEESRSEMVLGRNLPGTHETYHSLLHSLPVKLGVPPPIVPKSVSGSYQLGQFDSLECISKSPNPIFDAISDKSNRKAMNKNWSNQKANPALKTKAGNK